MNSLIASHDGRWRRAICQPRLVRRTSATRRLRVVRTLWTLFCFLACSYHSFQVTSLYFQWDINAEAFYFPTDPIIPPMVTVCLSPQHFKNPCPEPLVNGNCLPFMTTPQKFFDNSYKFDELVKSLKIVNPENKEDFYSKKLLTEFKLNYVTTYKWWTSICYSIDYLKSFKTRYYRHVDVRAMAITMFVLELHFEPPSIVLVTLGPRHDIPSKLTGGSVQLAKMKNRTNYYVTYRKKELSLLPSPYVTRCRDYAKERVKDVITQENCIRNCQFRTSLAENGGKMPLESLVFQDYSSVDDNRDLETNSSKSKFVDHCQVQCGLIECKIEEYAAWTTFKYVSTNINRGPGIALQLPTEADLKVNYKPKTTFWEYATLFGSVFGLWFGLSVQNCEHLAEKLLTKWKK